MICKKKKERKKLMALLFVKHIYKYFDGKK